MGGVYVCVYVCDVGRICWCTVHGLARYCCCTVLAFFISFFLLCFLFLFCLLSTARRALVYTRGSRLVRIPLLLSIWKKNLK